MKHMDIPIIDTHFHIWGANNLNLKWLSLLEGKLKSIYTIGDYQQAISCHSIVKSAYAEVDVINEDHAKEGEFAINLCSNKDNIVSAATLGCDLSDEKFENYIRHFSKSPYVKAMRHNFFASDPEICSQEIVVENTRLLGKFNIMSDLIYPIEKAFYGINLAKACPNTIFVIDHCGMLPPKADGKTRNLWQQVINDYAALDNTICKMSEPGSAAMDYQWEIEDVVNTIKYCVEAFGENRIIYASNWPVCEITASIEKWLNALDVALKEYPQSFWYKLLHQNAKKFYGIDL